MSKSTAIARIIHDPAEGDETTEAGPWTITLEVVDSRDQVEPLGQEVRLASIL